MFLVFWYALIFLSRFSIICLEPNSQLDFTGWASLAQLHALRAALGSGLRLQLENNDFVHGVIIQTGFSSILQPCFASLSLSSLSLLSLSLCLLIHGLIKPEIIFFSSSYSFQVAQVFGLDPSSTQQQQLTHTEEVLRGQLQNKARFEKRSKERRTKEARMASGYGSD